MTHLTIRELTPTDPTTIAQAFTAQGWHKPAAQYEQYWRESETGHRTTLIAEIKAKFAGYLTIIWHSHYPPFQQANIPEIVDFNVLHNDQRQGVGTALMDEAEKRITEISPTIGIGVGLMHDYGAAQVLYAHRGYIPDGRGIFANGRWLQYGDRLTINDDVALYLTKTIRLPQK